MLRCILKQGRNYYCLCWIDRNGKGKGPVVGGYNKATYISEMVGFPVSDYHFTYPPSGELHYSYKNMSTEQYLKVSCDELTYKKVVKGLPAEKITLIGRNFLNWLIPYSTLPQLIHYDQQPNCFYFPVHAQMIPLTSQLENFLNTTEEEAWEDAYDIIIDPDILGAGIINITCFVAHRDYLHLDTPEEGMQSWTVENTNGLSKIGLWVRFDSK